MMKLKLFAIIKNGAFIALDTGMMASGVPYIFSDPEDPRAELYVKNFGGEIVPVELATVVA